MTIGNSWKLKFGCEWRQKDLDVIWKANVPQKIKIFAWRAASNSLAVQVNRVSHHQATLGTCSICGFEEESIFHSLVTCPKAHALRMAMRDVWNFPNEEGSIIQDRIGFLFCWIK